MGGGGAVPEGGVSWRPTNESPHRMHPIMQHSSHPALYRRILASVDFQEIKARRKIACENSDVFFLFCFFYLENSMK